MSTDICFQWLIKDVCNMKRFIFHLDRIPNYLKTNADCNKWSLQWALLLGFLNNMLNSKKPKDEIVKLKNIISLFGTKFPMLQNIMPAARAAQDALVKWNRNLMMGYVDEAASNKSIGEITCLKATSLDTIVVSPQTVPDFDILAIVGGPIKECRVRLDILMTYLNQLEREIANPTASTKERHIIISGRGGHSLPDQKKDDGSLKPHKNWVEDGKHNASDSEAEFILTEFLTRFGSGNFPNLEAQCKISIDTAALDTVANAVMIKYLALQKFSLPGGSNEKSFKNKVIVSVSNIYHINRFLYLMKNFMPRGTHYGIVGADLDFEKPLIEKYANNADSILQAYDQSFTRDVGYIVPVLSQRCINADVGPQVNQILDLGLFEFLMHHGLYHRVSQISHELETSERTGEIWKTGMTSMDLVKYMGNFCLPFTSLQKTWDINNVLQTKIFRENCNVATRVMGADIYQQYYTFAAYECNSEIQSLEMKAGKRKKKRTRKKRKKRKKNKTRKK
jgi:hypothetical protein